MWIQNNPQYSTQNNQPPHLSLAYGDQINTHHFFRLIARRFFLRPQILSISLCPAKMLIWCRHLTKHVDLTPFFWRSEWHFVDSTHVVQLGRVSIYCNLVAKIPTTTRWAWCYHCSIWVVAWTIPKNIDLQWKWIIITIHWCPLCIYKPPWGLFSRTTCCP